MDSGEVSAIIVVVGGLLTAFNAGSLVPYVGPAVQGLLAIVTLVAAVWSWWKQRSKTSTIVAAGIK